MNEPTPPPIDLDDDAPVQASPETDDNDENEDTLLYRPCEKPESSAPSTPSFLSNIRRSFWQD